MPKFGELIATDVWEAGARTLTDLSAEEILDFPKFDDIYTVGAPVSSGSANTYGSWVELVADVGVGKRLIWAIIRNNSASEPNPGDIEFGEGGGSSESAVARVIVSHGGWVQSEHLILKALTDNARLSVRVKDNVAGALDYAITVAIA